MTPEGWPDGAWGTFWVGPTHGNIYFGQDGVGLLYIAETPADLTAERVMRVAGMLAPEEPTDG